MEDPVFDVVREAFARVVFTHKTYEKAVEQLGARVLRLKWVQIVLMSSTFGGLVSFVATSWPGLRVAAVLTSALALGLAVYQLSFNPAEEVTRYRRTADDLWLLRELYLNLVADYTSGSITQDQLRDKRDALAERLHRVYSAAPRTSATSYQAARRALKVDGEMSFLPEEVDSLLPPALRRGS